MLTSTLRLEGVRKVRCSMRICEGSRERVSCQSRPAQIRAVALRELQLSVQWMEQALLTFSTPGPKSSLRVAMMRVFLPAPDGP